MTTRRLILIAASAVVVSGCATAPTTPIAPAPVCSGPAQCRAEWDAARTFVINHAGYKIQTYSRDFMQTYNATNDSPSLAVIVNKQPDGAGRYKIVASFACDNFIGCVPNQWTTLDKFNRVVSAAGAQVTQ